MRVEGPRLPLDQVQFVADMPRDGAAKAPDKPAILCEDRSISYAELERGSARLLAAWQAKGLKEGDRIGYLGQNSELFYLAWFACARGGLVLAAYNWRYAAPELAFVLEDSKPALLMHDAALADTVAAACADLSAPPELWTTEGPAPSLRAAVQTDAPPPAEAERRLETPFSLLYTSGTTGRPKGALMPHGMPSLFALSYARSPQWEDWRASDVGLSCLPNFHNAGVGFMLMGLAVGATMVLTADPAPASLIALIRRHGVNRIFLVPTLIRMALDEIDRSGAPAPKLDGVYYGAAPIGGPLLARTIAAFGCRFTQFYGMTELSSTHVLGPDQHDPARPELMTTVGRPLAGVACEIRRPDGATVCAAGEPGEIWLRSDMRMLGYLNRPEATAEALVDGWYRSGDGGVMDADGFLTLTDRLKDMIITGGENVYPVEVENVLREHPAIADLAVVALPDDTWGEAVTAVAELAPGAEAPSLEDLRAFGRTRLAGYKLPRHLFVLPALPRTPSGKVQRGEAKKTVAAQVQAAG